MTHWVDWAVKPQHKQTNACKNEAKCVNFHKNHLSKSNQCEIWKKEKEIMKIKVAEKITYLEAKKIKENQPEITFAKVVQSLNTKPETKETSTQFNEKDCHQSKFKSYYSYSKT